MDGDFIAVVAVVVVIEELIAVGSGKLPIEHVHTEVIILVRRAFEDNLFKAFLHFSNMREKSRKNQ